MKFKKNSKHNKAKNSNAGKSYVPGAVVSKPKSQRKKILAGIIITGVILVGLTTFLFIGTREPVEVVSVCSPDHSEPIFQKSTNLVHTNEPDSLEQLVEVVESIEATEDYENYINCVYPALMYYLFIADEQSARQNFEYYDQLLAEGNAISEEFNFIASQSFFEDQFQLFEDKEEEFINNAVLF